MRSYTMVAVLSLTTSLAACSSTQGGGAGHIAAEPFGADGGAAPTDATSSRSRAGAQSGSRLKTRWLTGEDGSKIVAGMRDSEREEDCSFRSAADGATRCLPTQVAYTNTWYADAACAQLLAYTQKGCAAPKYASEAALAAGGCAQTAGTRIREVRARFRGATLYTKNTNGECTSSPSAGYLASYDLYTLAAELPPETFVAATETFE